MLVLKRKVAIKRLKNRKQSCGPRSARGNDGLKTCLGVRLESLRRYSDANPALVMWDLILEFADSGHLRLRRSDVDRFSTRDFSLAAFGAEESASDMVGGESDV